MDGLTTAAHTAIVAMLMRSESGVRTCSLTKERYSRTAGWDMSSGRASIVREGDWELKHLNDVTDREF
jgi:hypothetical protein